MKVLLDGDLQCSTRELSDGLDQGGKVTVEFRFLIDAGAPVLEVHLAGPVRIRFHLESHPVHVPFKLNATLRPDRSSVIRVPVRRELQELTQLLQSRL